MKREQIVAILNRKGGASKTVTTLNLAGALMELGLRVLIADLDPQASLTRLLLRDEPVGDNRGVGACIQPPRLPVADLIRPTESGIDLVPGDRSIESAAFAFHDNPGAFKRLRRALLALEGYDVILLDTPPALNFAATSAMLAAGWAILPTEATQQDLDALLDTLAALEELAADEEAPAVRLAIVPSKVRPDNVDTHGIALLREAFGDLVADPVPLATAVKRAMNERRPLSQCEPRARAMTSFRSLARRVAAATATTTERTASGDGTREVVHVGA